MGICDIPREGKNIKKAAQRDEAVGIAAHISRPNPGFGIDKNYPYSRRERRTKIDQMRLRALGSPDQLLSILRHLLLPLLLLSAITSPVAFSRLPRLPRLPLPRGLDIAPVRAALHAAGVEHVDDLRYLDRQLLEDVGLDSALAIEVMREMSPTTLLSKSQPHQRSGGKVWRSKRLLCHLSPELCSAVPIGFPQSDRVCSELSTSSSSSSSSTTLNTHSSSNKIKQRTVYAVARFNSGQRLAALGLWAQAIQHYEQALISRPQYSAAAAQLGVALMHAGRLHDAVDRFRLALSILKHATHFSSGSPASSTVLHTEHNMRLALAKLHAKDFVERNNMARAANREALLRGSLRRATALAAARDTGDYGNNFLSGGTNVTRGRGRERKGLALFLEFGVFRGDSLRIIRRELSGSGYEVEAFDSFDGLPEAWEIESPHPLANAPRGTFRVADLNRLIGLENRSALHGLLLGQAEPEVEGVKLHVGLFNATLPDFLNEHKRDNVSSDLRPFVAFAHIDCDLYSSTRYVLNVLSALVVPGTVLQFDEMIGWPGWETRGEFRALQESGLRFSWLETAGQAVSIQIL